MPRLTEFVEFLRNKRYWILISLIYLSLIYSTSISYSYGPENTISNSFFNRQIMTKDTPFKEHYPDLGKYPDASSLQKTEFWKLYDVWGDAGYYLRQAEDPSLSIPPYKYRVLPPLIAASIHKLTGLHLAYSYVLMNIIFVYLIGIVFTYFCKRCFNFSDTLSLLGGVLAITSVGITRTLPFPMLEPVHYFFFLLVILSLKIKNDYLYLISSICGVLSKELLIIVGVLYFVNNYSLAKDNRYIFVKTLLLSSIPLIIFSGVRILLGGHAMDVALGVNILAGEFPPYGLNALSSLPLFVSWSITFSLTFSFIWFGLLNIRRDRFIYINTIFALPLVILATFLFSGQVSRQIGVLFPLIIVLFLFFFQRK